MNEALQKVEKLLQIYHFKNDLGETIDFTPGQKQVMATIVNHGIDGKNRIQIETPTQYGKSSSIAAALTMICTLQEKWAIVAGTGDKAQIIMDYFIDFALDNPIPRKLLDVDIPLDRLKRERNRRELNFMSGFSVRVFSADSHNKQALGNAVMGHGAPFVILDEAALVDDMIESKVVRMLIGYSTTKNLLIKVGNPFYRNHFLKTHNDPNYYLLWLDYKQALEEGRFTQEAIDEAKGKLDFGVLYEVKFPEEGKQDLAGWIPLFTESEIERAFIDNSVGFGSRRIGVDVAGGGRNKSIIVERYSNVARILWRKNTADSMEIAEEVINIKNQSSINEIPRPDNYFIDSIGVGKGCYDVLIRNIENVMGVNAGLEPMDKDRFVNLRAEMYQRVKEWFGKGSKLIKDDAWYQLTKIRYRTKLEGTRGKMILMSKDDMFKQYGVESPDEADALAMTFAIPDMPSILEMVPEESKENYNKYGLFNEI